jgi:hypothetical protein
VSAKLPGDSLGIIFFAVSHLSMLGSRENLPQAMGFLPPRKKVVPKLSY